MVKPNSLKIVWDRKALDHFKDILAFLAKQSDQAPKKVKTAIINRLDLIKKNPLMCDLIENGINL